MSGAALRWANIFPLVIFCRLLRFHLVSAQRHCFFLSLTGAKGGTASAKAAMKAPAPKQPAAAAASVAQASDAEAPGTPPPGAAAAGEPPLKKTKQAKDVAKPASARSLKTAPAEPGILHSAAEIAAAAAAKDAAAGGFEVVPRGGKGKRAAVAKPAESSDDDDSSSDEEGRVANKAHAPAESSSDDEDFMDGLDVQGKVGTHFLNWGLERVLQHPS